ncbi:MAG: biotin--[acetyl-CoA-carboxylase] ligase [Lachnospiraceae bacterium]|nr:biotin--[acetyl-CoA-carboxylase] ligase [Lachnospiraceae bacterium]
MKNQILKLLRDSTEYVSGQELCERFNVSRTAVWKAVEQLKKDGYTIEAVRNRGYRLITGGCEVYNKAEIDASIGTEYIGRNSFFYNIIGSTNSEAKRLADEGAPDGTLVVADRQTAGKGRRGRSWVSPEGTNIYFSLLLKPDFHPSQAPMLTLVMALAVAEAVKGLDEKAEAKIKWPNDIVINGKKVCGILTEMSVERDYIQHVVIGTGINVKRQTFDAEFADHASSVETELDAEVSRSRLIGLIMEAFEKYYEEFKKAGNLSTIKSEYEKYLVNRGREVCVLDPKGEYKGIAMGINDSGELLVKTDDGKTTEVYAGEVSVRGIYGYV